MKHQHKKNTLILNNFFSIRKLKFGVASITLGSALIIGAHHEAQAAENNNSQGTQNSTTIDQTNKNSNQSAQQGQSKPADSVATQNTNTQNNQATTQNAPTTNKNNSNSKSNELSQTLNFQVQKDKTNDVSHMDQYVQHPGKVIKKDDKYYFQITLDNASWWKSFRFFDENETELPTTVVDDNTEKDTKTVNMEVTPGMNNIISKVHIVIPALKYDHEYTTHIELESVIPTIEDPEPTATQNQAKQNDTTNVEQPDADKKQDTAKKPSAPVSPTDTNNQNTKTDSQDKKDDASTDQQPDANKKQDTTQKPSAPVSDTVTNNQDAKTDIQDKKDDASTDQQPATDKKQDTKKPEAQVSDTTKKQDVKTNKKDDTSKDKQPDADKKQDTAKKPSAPISDTTKKQEVKTKKQDKKDDTPKGKQPVADKKQDKAKKPVVQDSKTKTNKIDNQPKKHDKIHKDSNDPKPKKDQKHDKDSKEAEGKDSVVKDNSKSKTSKELPETGSKQEPNSNSLVFSLIALLSSLFLLKRKNNKNI
ncbi:NEAT domain-containing protein [Staphylococcus capitis]|uniref:NEAT domain-containing protein n=1 Tax=Staphylococcus capitis TaxID=29388 RepID=UPI000D1C1F61|nr:NEAT domain-containing protein [Staphylococcus capitis]PTH04639.1 YSIRK signal domain/LPXTG anchor domain surface protein [Staphylococcus capitis]PTH07456.1 YSIRK signal domain/LPXTG anchor domain surface protein [Staphylococcus capitis]PTH17932.1 YSIRK signal domain/LPXTG anchor domain surface protein [Staphylococcus capitis]RIM40886.1 YSIRK-type signal peptide-containing protein [Staphylococcus capitis]RIM41310.1 YSIRK-type signal peptide-containing protein [Staphylococcus capitis]